MFAPSRQAFFCCHHGLAIMTDFCALMFIPCSLSLYQSNQCLLLSLAIVLQCGNLMNAPSSLGKAAGFKLDVLERLSHIKSIDHLPIANAPRSPAEYSSLANISGPHKQAKAISDSQSPFCGVEVNHRKLRLKHTCSALYDSTSLLSYVALRLQMWSILCICFSSIMHTHNN